MTNFWIEDLNILLSVVQTILHLIFMAMLFCIFHPWSSKLPCAEEGYLVIAPPWSSRLKHRNFAVVSLSFRNNSRCELIGRSLPLFCQHFKTAFYVPRLDLPGSYCLCQVSIAMALLYVIAIRKRITVFLCNSLLTNSPAKNRFKSHAKC